MKKVYLRVWLPVTDPVAISAIMTLKNSMKIPLQGIESSNLWEFEFEDSIADQMALTRDIVEKTGLFVNPNRDRFEITDDLSNLDRSSRTPETKVRWVVVRDGNGDRADIIDKLSLRYSISGISSICHGRLWRLLLIVSEDRAADELVKQIVLTESRKQGLLANPHAQTWQMI